MLYKSKKNFLLLTDEEKLKLVLELQQKRTDQLIEFRKSKTKTPSKRKTKSVSFKDPNLQKLFDELPSDLKQIVTGRRSIKYLKQKDKK